MDLIEHEDRSVELPIAVAAATCPSCGAATAGLPYCKHDGTLLKPFSIRDHHVEEALPGSSAAFTFGVRNGALAVQISRSVSADFLRVAQAASSLSHENIVAISGFGHDDTLDADFLVVERLRGRTLADVMTGAQPMSWQRVVPILSQLSRALGAAHASGVTHRDLDPRNVLLLPASNDRDIVKLGGFGLSRLAGNDDRVTLTGTAACMAPEQLRGDGTQDLRVDLYALGAIAYEMLSAHPPHEAPTPVGYVANVLTKEPRVLRTHAAASDIPRALDDVIMRCLARDPLRRPASANEIEAVLAGLVDRAPLAGHADELIGQTISSYRIESLIGSGGVGAVYLAEHPVIGSKVAVKVLLPEAMSVPGIVERFIREARTSSQIGSASLPRYYDFGYLPSGRPFVIMEHLDGKTVAQQLRERGAFTLVEAARIAEQAASALAQAHAAGIVHRDLKPANLFLVAGSDGQPLTKVIDFGVAVQAGTPCYSAPEQMLGESAQPAADIYSLGATLFEMLSGEPPFAGASSDMLRKKTLEPAPRVDRVRPGLPTTVADDIARMLACDPNDRPISMFEVSTMLARWGAKRREQVSDEELAPAKTNRAAQLAVGGMAFVAVIGAAFAIFGHRAPVAVVPVAVPVAVSAPVPVAAPVAAPVTVPAPVAVPVPVPVPVAVPVPAPVTAKKHPLHPHKTAKIGEAVIANPFE